MIAPVPLLLAAFFVVAGVHIAGVADGRLARRVAVYQATAATALSIVLTFASPALFDGARIAGLTVVAGPDGPTRVAVVVVCAAGLLAVALSPTASHPPATLERMLYLLAIACAFVGLPHGASTVVLWTLSAWLVWGELRRRDQCDGLDRLFGAYHVPSVLLFAVGTLLTTSGSLGAGTVLVMLALLVRLAIVPLHGWWPRFVERAPIGVVVTFSMGSITVLAQLNSAAPLPAVTQPTWFVDAVALLGCLTAVLAAVFAVVQNDARRALAFLMMSETGLVVFGFGNESPVAVAGAVLIWQASVLATTGFATTLAALEARRGSLSLATPGGNFSRTPRLAVTFLLFGLAAVGFPLSLGFAGEHLLLDGSVAQFPLVWGTLIVAVGLHGMTVTRCFFVLFAGDSRHFGERDLTSLESYAATTALAVLLFSGALPGLAVDAYAMR